jgi:hypothetical protein
MKSDQAKIHYLRDRIKWFLGWWDRFGKIPGRRDPECITDLREAIRKTEPNGGGEHD